MKKHITFLAALIFLVTWFASCKKDNKQAIPTSSLTIVNAIVGGTDLVSNFNSGQKLLYYSGAAQIPHNGSLEFGGYVGKIPLSLSQVSDTTHTVFNETLELAPSGIYSLFLAGTVEHPDPLLVQDKITSITDSAVNVRFINLGSGFAPISIMIKNQPQPVVNSLAYKSLTAFLPFKNFTTDLSNGRKVRVINFEFRDATTQNLLESYKLSIDQIEEGTLVTQLFKNLTIAVVGTPNNPDITVINNY